MSEEQLTALPASFVAVYAGRGGRLSQGAAQLRARYELCEDLANHLSPSAQALHHDDGLGKDDVLQRCHAGLNNSASGLNPGEADWVVRRLAELLRWPAPEPGNIG